MPFHYIDLVDLALLYFGQKPITFVDISWEIEKSEKEKSLLEEAAGGIKKIQEDLEKLSFIHQIEG